MKPPLLETILHPERLTVRFQPIFRLQRVSSRVDSFEALIRGPKGTHFERADILFDYVRRKRAEAEVDRSCIAAICREATKLPAHFRINVNVHAATLGKNSDFADFLRLQAKKNFIAMNRFTVEIVEHAPTCNIPDLMHSIAMLRDAGVSIALDDVGLGQSNFRMILDCSPEYFKLDSYFVMNLTKDTKRRAVVQSVLTLAHAMESIVVAEGVQTAQDMEELEHMGVELVQTNFLCAALPLDELRSEGYLGFQRGKRAPARLSEGTNLPICDPSLLMAARIPPRATLAAAKPK